MRIGEIAALKWTDIDLENRLIHVKQTFQRLPIGCGSQRTQLQLDRSKTESSNRVIPIGFNLYKYLKKWQKKHRDRMFALTRKDLVNIVYSLTIFIKSAKIAVFFPFIFIS